MVSASRSPCLATFPSGTAGITVSFGLKRFFGELTTYFSGSALMELLNIDVYSRFFFSCPWLLKVAGVHWVLQIITELRKKKKILTGADLFHMA